jgi:hypothetical protein
VPTVPRVAEPNVSVVPPAHDIALIGGSILVHADVPIDAHVAIGVHMGTSVFVRGAMMAAPTVVTSTAMASAHRPF